MKNFADIINRVAYLPLVFAVLFTQGGTEGNCMKQEMEYGDGQTEGSVSEWQTRDGGKGGAVEVFQGGNIPGNWKEKDGDGISYVRFCREWDESGEETEWAVVVK